MFYNNISYKIRCFIVNLWLILKGASSAELSKPVSVHRHTIPPTLVDVDSVVHMCSTNPCMFLQTLPVA